MPTIPGPPSARHSVEEQFLELVYADEALLRAEFDAIVAREWPNRHPPTRPRPASRASGPHPRRPLAQPGVRAPHGTPRHSRGQQLRRQRSPPRPSQPTAPTHSPNDHGHMKGVDPPIPGTSQ